MQVYGVDLSVWLRDRRWRSLVELIDELPTASRLNEAIQNDPEAAELLAAQPEPDDPWSPRSRDWDLAAVQLQDIRQLLSALYSATVAAASGKKPPKVHEFPAPVTEVTRAKERHAQRYADDLVARFLPPVS